MKKIEKAREALRDAITIQDGYTAKLDIIDKELDTLRGQRETALIAQAEGTGNQKALDTIIRDLESLKLKREGLQLLEDKAADKVRILRGELADAERERSEALKFHVSRRESEYQEHLAATAEERVRALARTVVGAQVEYANIFTDTMNNAALRDELAKLRKYFLEAAEQTGRKFFLSGTGYMGAAWEFTPLAELNSLKVVWEADHQQRVLQFQAEFEGN